MFTTGAVYLPFFSLMTFLIAVRRGEVLQLDLHDVARPVAARDTAAVRDRFLTMFLIGGINGAFSASVPVDFALHDTYFVVAHLHYVLFGGSVFGIMAGLYYWFPKMTGRMLNETPGQDPVRADVRRLQPDVLPDARARPVGHAPAHRRLLVDGGLERPNLAGHDRRLPRSPRAWCPLLWNVFISLRSGEIAGDDPWEGNTLEWATTSPPPPYNFDRLPEIRSERPVFDVRHGPDAWPDARRSATDRWRPTATPSTTDPSTARSRALSHDAHGRHQQCRPGDAPVPHLGGDVLRGPVRGLLQRPGERPVVAAAQPGDRRRSSARDPAPGRAGDGPPDPVSSFTCQFAVWAHPPWRPAAFVRNIAVTFVIGIIFLVMQAIDYATLGTRA